MTKYENLRNMSVQDMAEAIAEIATDCNDCGGCSDRDGNCLSCIESKLNEKIYMKPEKPHNIRLNAFDKNGKPIFRGECPNIKCHIDVFSDVNTKFCRRCGQALDWSDHYIF